MAVATYQSTCEVGRQATETTEETHSCASVLVDEHPVRVKYWPSLIPQWGASGVIAYVEAEALWQTGNYADARNRLAELAQTVEWAQKWIDEHPDPVAAKTWEVDPLLG